LPIQSERSPDLLQDCRRRGESIHLALGEAEGMAPYSISREISERRVA
jgi:hypothetical protein